MAGDATATPRVVRPLMKTFACPNCGGEVRLSLPGRSLVATCRKCLSVIDVAATDFKVLAKQYDRDSHTPAILLGTTGRLAGRKFKTVGFVRKCDETSQYWWHEYLLFSPYHGYRWLVENQGHWTLFVPLTAAPELGSHVARYQGKYYRRFLTGESRVSYVVGEFYWRVKAGDKADVADFIRPPEILSYEKTKDEINWTHGVYLKPEEVARAFALKQRLPAPVGIAPNQPSPYGNGPKLYKAAAIGLAALFLCQVASNLASAEKVVFETAGMRDVSLPVKEEVSEPFDITGGQANIHSELRSSASNSWLELQMSLVNEDSGQSFEFQQLTEYYYGYEGGENWSEGSTEDEVFVEQVPPGKYRISVEAASDKNTDYSLKVVRDKPRWANFVWSAIYLLIWPVGLAFMAVRFESARWATSDEAE